MVIFTIKNRIRSWSLSGKWNGHNHYLRNGMVIIIICKMEWSWSLSGAWNCHTHYQEKWDGHGFGKEQGFVMSWHITLDNQSWPRAKGGHVYGQEHAMVTASHIQEDKMVIYMIRNIQLSQPYPRR